MAGLSRDTVFVSSGSVVLKPTNPVPPFFFCQAQKNHNGTGTRHKAQTPQRHPSPLAHTPTPTTQLLEPRASIDQQFSFQHTISLGSVNHSLFQRRPQRKKENKKKYGIDKNKEVTSIPPFRPPSPRASINQSTSFSLPLPCPDQTLLSPPPWLSPGQTPISRIGAAPLAHHDTTDHCPRWYVCSLPSFCPPAR